MSGPVAMERKRKREVILRLIALGLTETVIAERAGCGVTMVRKIRRQVREGKL
jgi:DNA-binding CsgD family transcriptional regulator